MAAAGGRRDGKAAAKTAMWAEATTLGWIWAAFHGIGLWWVDAAVAVLETWVFGVAYARCGGRSWDGATPPRSASTGQNGDP